MADSPSKKAAAAIAKRKGRYGGLDPAYSRYNQRTGELTDPEGTTLFSENGPVRRKLRRATGRPEEAGTGSLRRGGGR